MNKLFRFFAGLSFNEIDQLTYDELIKDPAAMLNLKNADHASTIIKEVIARDPK